jgi:hypothetical protein
MPTAELIPLTDDEIDAEILRKRVAGLSVRQIAQEFAMPLHAVNAALDRNLPQIDAAYRRRSIALSVLRLDQLHEVFHRKAVNESDIEAGNLCIRIEAERRAVLGLTGSNFDPVQLTRDSHPEENSLSAFERALEHMKMVKMVEALARDHRPEEPSASKKPREPDDPTSDEAPE